MSAVGWSVGTQIAAGLDGLEVLLDHLNLFDKHPDVDAVALTIAPDDLEHRSSHNVAVSWGVGMVEPSSVETPMAPETPRPQGTQGAYGAVAAAAD